MDVKKLIQEYGEPYSKILNIDLNKGDPAYTKWLLASILYAKPIREESATKTYHMFEANGLTTAHAIADAGWDRLVEILDKGSYTRYDFSTADRLMDIFGRLQEQYNGSLRRLYEQSSDSKDLERRLMSLGKGIGPVTVSVFLRDMQEVWPKAKPGPTPRVKKTASMLGIKDIQVYAKQHRLNAVELATALHRYSRVLKKAGKA